MRAFVDADACTGCGLCCDICPEVFEMKNDLAVVQEDPVPDENEDTCRDAVDSCPVEAISLEE
ncbi:MAG: ferredoxin [Sedimentisphaerales bacterium]|nr:ferredoxin [Sedimentisphaerales bacterium]